MTELKHPAHECVLTSPEIVADGICNLCYKDEPVELACNTCNFDLCKHCANLPEKMSRAFHPEHPLELCVGKNYGKTTFNLCSGCGNLFSESFYYKCKECEIYLDLGCAMLKNMITVWDAKEMFHYSHAHLLRRCKLGQKASGSCLLCELPLTASAICYGCFQCYMFVHERCLNHLPRQIQHPVHPAHPLKRLDFTHTCGPGKICDACQLPIDGSPFGCLECNVDFHLRCLDSLLRGLVHKSHEHSLFYVATGADDVFNEDTPCQICFGTCIISVDSYYHCVECELKFHFECLGIPESVFKKSYHIHPLVCKIFQPEDDPLEYCGVCETIVYAENHAYSCQECDFLGHIECILREAVPSLFYLKDLYSRGESITQPIDGDDCETKELENKVMVAGIEHIHVLTFGHNDLVSCNICHEFMRDISWKCETCRFHAHDYCVKLGQPSKHPFHLNHLLILLPGNPAGAIMNCENCKRRIYDFNLFCRICNFIICTYCMVEAKRIQGELQRGHKFIRNSDYDCWGGTHILLEVMVSRSYLIACTICDERLCGTVLSCVECREIYHPRCIELGRQKLQKRVSHPLHTDHILKLKPTSGFKCIACKLSMTMYGYSCSTCKVGFHFNCIKAGKHKSHKHYLYNFWMDDSRLSRACSLCGKPCGASFHGCIDCKNFSAHVECIGFPANVRNQQHHHIVVQSYSWCKMSCSLCELEIESSDNIHYSCNHCKDVFHMKCIMSMDEREAATEEEQTKDIYLMYIERDLFSLLKDEALYQDTSSDDEDSDDEDDDS